MSEDERNGENVNIEHVENLHTGDVHHHHHQHNQETTVILLDSSAISRVAENQHTNDTDEETSQRTVEEVKRQQLEDLDRHEVPLTDQTSTNPDIPDVNPALVETDIYKGIDPEKVEQIQASAEKSYFSRIPGRQITMNTLLSNFEAAESNERFISLYGNAGCGKTFLSKKIVRYLTDNYLVLYFRFMYMNYTQNLTLQELLIDKHFPNLSKSKCNAIFKWIVDNQEKCVLLFDGLDQATWVLENAQPVRETYHTPLPIQQLVANLCSKVFLGKCWLIFTSRPHSLLPLPLQMRPKVTIFVHDLSTADMKTLFFFYAGEKATELWEKLETKSPQILDFCHNPMLLQFVVYACLCGDAGRINTMTSIFDAVLEQLGHSQHSQGCDIDTLKKHFGKMAYEGMLRKSVVFTNNDLRKVGLEYKNVQDVVIKFARFSWISSRRVLEGSEALFCCTHQMLQEVFAAYYICFFMPTEDFNRIIQEVSNGGHWTMVRRFISGILLGSKNATSLIFSEVPSTEATTSKDQQNISRKLKGSQVTKRFSKVFLKMSKPFRKSSHEATTSQVQQNGTQKQALDDRAGTSSTSLSMTPSSSSSASTLWNNEDSLLPQQHKKKRFLEELSQVFPTAEKYGLLDLLVDLQECSTAVRDRLACFSPRVLNFYSIPMSNTRCHAIGDFVMRIQRQDLVLRLLGCKLDTEKMQQIYNGMAKAKVKFEVVDISRNELGRDGGNVVADLVTKVGRVLYMDDCGLNARSIEIVKETLRRLENPPGVTGLELRDEFS